MRAARDFVSRVLTDRGFAGEHDTVLLLVSELATNAVRHAATPFEVVVELRPGSLRVEVIDHDVDHLPRVRRPSPQDTSGRGLLILEELAAGWGTDELADGRKSVWFTLA